MQRFLHICSYMLLVLTLVSDATGFGAFTPYILGNKDAIKDGAALQKKLQTAGFEVLGSFSPAKNYETVAFTHDALKKEASKAPVPIGAVLRASVVQNGGKTEVSYCSPYYWAYASGLEGSSSETLAKMLEDALGKERGFGSAKGLSESKLRSFQYAFAMPKVTDLDKLGTFASFNQATKAVTEGIQQSQKVREVYSVDLDDHTRLIGVSVLDDKGSEPTILGVADATSDPKLGGLYGPYEIFIKGGDVMATRGRFRIAIAFPDLSMSTFMRIVAAPGAILDSLKTVTSTCTA